MIPLSREKFQDALEKGLGRAVQHVRVSRPEEVRDDLLNVSLHCLVFDAQCEGWRAPWLMEMFQITGETEFYRKPILERLDEISDTELRKGRDFWQLYHFAKEFALRGDKEAHESVYRAFDRMIHDNFIEGSEELIELDGIAGLVYILEKTGQRIRDGFGFCNAKYDIESAEEKFGKETVQNAIETAKKQNEFVRLYFERAAMKDPYFDGPFVYRERLPDLSLREWTDQIMDEDFSDFEIGDEDHPFLSLDMRRRIFVRVARKAETAELEYAFEKLMQTDNPMRQYCLLGIFAKRPMPRVEKKILDLIDSENVSLTWYAAQALSSTSHEWIREKGLELLQSDPPQSNWYSGIELLENSFRPGDQRMIEKALVKNVFPDIHSLHGAGLSLKHLIGSNPQESFADCCLWFYDQTPCSLCREDFVKHLVEKASAPPELLEECRDDCSEETRELVSAKE